jgi:hypothetical protein
MREYFAEINADMEVFPLRTAKQVAKAFNVRPSSVLNWARSGLIEGNYQLLSGRSVRIVFTNRALCRFFDENHPSIADLSSTDFHPKSSRAQRIQKMVRMKRIYARRRKVK